MNYKINISFNKEKAIKERKTVNLSSKNQSCNYSDRGNKESTNAILGQTLIHLYIPP